MGKFWIHVFVSTVIILCPPLGLLLLFIVEG